MTWAKLDDQFYCNDKQLKMSHAAFRLYVCALSFASQDKTATGFLTRPRARGLAGMLGLGEKQIQELVLLSAWEEVDGGWLIHDYDEYVERGSADRTRAWRARKREAPVTECESHGDVTRARAPAGGNPGPEPVPVPVRVNALSVPTAAPDLVRSDDRNENVAIPLCPEAEQLLDGYHKLTGFTITDTDRVAAEDFVLELGKRLTPAQMVKRMNQHVVWCEAHNKGRPRSLKAFWTTLRIEAEHQHPPSPSEIRERGTSQVFDELRGQTG